MVRRVKSHRGLYEIDVKRKITNIIGNSGRGKTSLIRAIEAQRRNIDELSKSFGVPLILARPHTTATAVAALNALDNHTICVVDCDGLSLTHDLARAINKAPIPFILFSRDVVGALSIHYDSVYTFERADRSWKTVRVYNPKLGLRRDLWTVVEDSGLGYRFYKHLLQANVNVCIAGGSGGFDKIPTTVNSLLSSHKEVQVIADAATFGGCCCDISDLSRVTCFLPECFEELLMNSEMFTRFQSDSLKVNPLSQTALQYPSLERYYEKCVGSILSMQAHQRYAKGINNDSKRTEKCVLGSCFDCNKRPRELGGNGSCRFFSMYNKPLSVSRTINFNTGDVVTPSKTGDFVMVESSGSVQSVTSAKMAEMLSKASIVSPSSLSGKIPERHVWKESGCLYAVKVDNRWKIINREQ